MRVQKNLSLKNPALSAFGMIPGSPMARRTKHEIKVAQRMARKQVCYDISYVTFFIYRREIQIGEGSLPWAIFCFRIFSNYVSQKFGKIKITVWKSDNYVWKFLFRFVLILLHIKSASKKV